jgi:6-phosphogluconolactonase (cycloisomerase 2 family)
VSNGGQGAAPALAQIQISPNGKQVVVTEKSTNLIDVYEVKHNGTLDGPSISNTAGVTPFGFDFNKRGVLVVSEAASGTLSSYRVSDHGANPISALVSTTQAAPCWVIITQDGKTAYTTNAGSDSISSFTIARNGRLTLIQARAGETDPAGHPTDMALNRSNRFLFVLAGGTHTIEAYLITAHGGLARVGTASGLPASATGLAAQ